MADGDYSHGHGKARLSEYSVYSRDHFVSSHIKPVGSKRPVFYNANPCMILMGLFGHGLKIGILLLYLEV